MTKSDLMTLIKNLERGGKEKHTATRTLYTYLKNIGCEKIISSLIKNDMGSPEDAKDLFHESFIILIEKLGRGEFKEEFSIKNYLVGISKYIWMNEKTRRSRYQMVEEPVREKDWEVVDCERDYIDKEKKVVIQKVLEATGERCKKILSLWMFSYSMSEIAAKLSLSSERLARKYKYRCHKKLIKHLKKNPSIIHTLNA